MCNTYWLTMQGEFVNIITDYICTQYNVFYNACDYKIAKMAWIVIQILFRNRYDFSQLTFWIWLHFY